MRRTIRSQHAIDAGTGGFLVWIAVYAVFMLALIVLNGGPHIFDYQQMPWPVVASAR